MSESCTLKTLGKPCPSCPWRINKTAQDIPNFDLERAERLAQCSPDEDGFGPAPFSPLFACHQSVEGKDIVCAGWLATVGHTSPRARIATRDGRLPVESLKPGVDWPELHQSYPEVLDKLRATTLE